MFERGVRFGRRLLGFWLVLLLAGAANAADIKIASVAPDGSHWMQQMRAGATLASLVARHP